MASQRVDAVIASARALLERARGASLSDNSPAPALRGGASDPEVMEHTIALAELLQRASELQQTGQERERAALLARMLSDGDGHLLTLLLTDRAYRSNDPDRVVDAARQ